MPRKTLLMMNSCSTPLWKCERGQYLEQFQPSEGVPHQTTSSCTTWSSAMQSSFHLDLLIPHLCKRCSEILGVQAEHTWGRMRKPRGFYTLRGSPIVSSPKRVCAPAEDAAVFHTGGKKPVLLFLNWEVTFGKSSNLKHLIPPLTTLK